VFEMAIGIEKVVGIQHKPTVWDCRQHKALLAKKTTQFTISHIVSLYADGMLPTELGHMVPSGS
jgi:hypothetical protein